jgi:UDP-N-acetylmuramate: L-alanyl-gamma-D-glutamyl-meso-diaminopimelate ligase
VATYGAGHNAGAGHSDGGTWHPTGEHRADYEAGDVRFSADGAAFSVVSAAGDPPTGVLRLPMSGRHNVENAVGVYAAARHLGVSHEAIAHAFETFRGVKRRQEPRGEPGGVLIIDDFAHHPTAVRETIAGIRERYAGRRLWSVFEPRSNTSRRNTYQAEYEGAFRGSDRVVLRVPEPHDKVPADQRLDVEAIVRHVEAGGTPAHALPAADDIADLIVRDARAGDVVLVMSNGSFGGLIPALLDRLARR